ncbi:sacsin-like, partial [Pomacea canaliculata]|uniref:sacsin-like n=1 Tax=Pomacea canaliculata TaxID=400727 RepID=UPI000D7352A3
MSAISNSDYTDLGLQLKKTPFIEGKDGHLYEASKFYSPHEPVFKVMCSPDAFPPAPYSNRDWKNFMESVGMISLITVDMFIDFAKKLAKEGRNKITQHVENASMTLLMCLFDKMDLGSGDLLSIVKDIPFVMPSTWRRDEASKALTNITPAFCPERLVSFSESCRESHLYLVWSSSAILNPKADPYKLLDITDQELIGSQLGIQKGAPASKVVQHLKNICDVLTGQESQQAIQTLRTDTNLIRKVMKKLYKYLSCVTEEIYIEVLKSLPIVYHIESNRMLHTENVVIEITKDNEIDGFLMKAPHKFGDFFNLFKRLGVAEHVTADHYARVLQGLKTCAGEKQLHVEEMKKVAQAVKGLFSCLNLNSQNESSLLAEDLYLPSEEGVLRKSSELIFVDDFILHSRLKALPPNKSFFIGFQKLEIYNFSRMNIKQLPDKYGMSLLTSVVKETVPDCLRSQAVDSKMSRDLAANMTHPTVIEAVARVMYHSSQERNIPFPENPIETIAEKLSHISVREISGLETVLMVNDQVVPKSKQKTSEFVCKNEDDQKKCLVYIDTNILRLRGETDMKVFNSAIVAAMVFVLEFESVWLKLIVDDVRLAQQSMDKNRVLPLDLSMRDNRSVIPPAGDFVPVSHHCYLDNSFYYFREGEHVGFEVYDPCEDEEDLEDTAPVYIYGIIVQEIGGDGQVDTNLLSKKYLVDLGPERGQIEITATRLYKFIRRSCESMSFDLVQYSGVRNETPECVEEQSVHQDLKTVLREIRRLLIEASLLPESERRRVHKRLILKWHPDKNPGNETFCTEVMKALNRYLDLIRQGKVLPADEDDDYDNKEKTFHSRSSPPTFSSPFFDYMYRRGTRHRRDFDCHKEEFNTRFSSGQYKKRSHSQSFSESAYQGGP